MHLPVQQTQIQSLGWGDALEKEMATHSSILAWEIQQTEEPSGLVHGVAKELDMIATKTATIFLFIYYSFTYLFAYIHIWLCWVLVVACGIF